MDFYHHLVETFKFARGLKWRLWDPRSHPEVQVKRLGSPGLSREGGSARGHCVRAPESLAGWVGGLCAWLVPERDSPGWGGVSRSGRWKRQA